MNKQIKNEDKLKLHLGCGDKRIEGFINVDVRPLPGVDIVDDISNLNLFEPNSADLIYASHLLEHFGRRVYLDVLKNWFNILKPGGILRIAVPDFGAVVEHYNENGDIKILRGFLYGGQTYDHNFHYCGWDEKTLVEDLINIGFIKAYRYDWRNTEHSHIDDFSQCYLPHMDKENGKLMSLNIEAVK